MEGGVRAAGRATASAGSAGPTGVCQTRDSLNRIAILCGKVASRLSEALLFEESPAFTQAKQDFGEVWYALISDVRI